MKDAQLLQHNPAAFAELMAERQHKQVVQTRVHQLRQYGRGLEKLEGSVFRWTPEQSRKGDRGRERQMWRELHPMALWMAAGSSCDVSRGYKSYKHLSLSFPPEKGRFIIKKGFGASCN